MSRFEYSEDGWDNEFANLDYGRWERNVRQTLTGKRGRALLEELESALLAMPEKRLITGWLSTPAGECCTVGALAAYRLAQREGVDFREAASLLFGQVYDKRHPSYRLAAERGEGSDEDKDITVDYGTQALGGSRTLIKRLGYLNDDDLGHLTPEQRYERVLRRVRLWLNGEELNA